MISKEIDLTALSFEKMGPMHLSFGGRRSGRVVEGNAR